MSKITQAEIDAMRDSIAREASIDESSAAAVDQLRTREMVAQAQPGLLNSSPPRPLPSRPSPLLMKPLVFDDDQRKEADGDTPPGSSASATAGGQIDEPCTYEIKGMGGRIPKGVSVDINQMGMENWDPAAAGVGDGGGQHGEPPSEPADTWNLVLDNTPSEMMAALDECAGGVDAINEMGYTCVMWGALYGKEEHLIVLLECEADVHLTLKEDGNYSKTYPAGSTALDIARLTQEKTGSDRELIMDMLKAAMGDKWEEWKETERGALVWSKWRTKWERDKARRERKEKEKAAKERKRRAAERAAIDRLRDSPYAASVATVKMWLSSLGHNIGQYSAVFETHAVDGATLMRLTERHLKNELKVRTLGQRLKILRARDALDQENDEPLRPPFASKEEVGRWLAHIGLQIYSYAFESNDIDGGSLCELSEDQLREDLGVRILGHRLKVLAERDGFREQCQVIQKPCMTEIYLQFRCAHYRRRRNEREGALDCGAVLLGRRRLSITVTTAATTAATTRDQQAREDEVTASRVDTLAHRPLWPRRLSPSRRL